MSCDLLAGHRRDWQGEWLRARTTAELSLYLPMVAPLLDLTAATARGQLVCAVFDPGQHRQAADESPRSARTRGALARESARHAWTRSAFVASYAPWTMRYSGQQQHYHHRVAIASQHALLHRVHRVNSVLFGLTALGAFSTW